ncbi:MAG: hypothetical protein HOG49_01300 [Candidatus Scalindua sp.]|nr:hypothetical protein [Candidatus Scalindua sp.]
MTHMRLDKRKTKTLIPKEPTMRGKTLYILYKYDLESEELASDGPFLSKDEAYEKMISFLQQKVCSWVVVYNG